MKGNKSKPGAGSTTGAGKFPHKAKVSSTMGKGSTSGAGKFPYAKKGK